MKGLNDYVRECHKYAVENGFYDERFNIAEKLMLVVSELSEALEVCRKDPYWKEYGFPAWMVLHTPSEQLVGSLEAKDKKAFEEFESIYKDSFQDEIADVLIRIFDLCGAVGIADIDRHVRAKKAYNAMRPRKHGKEF